MVIATRNEFNQRVVELTKLNGLSILIPAHQIRFLEEIDISQWYQSSNYGTKVSYSNLEVSVIEGIDDIKQAIGWNISL